MNQEDKQLLSKDLKARLSYGVKCTTKSSWNGIYTIEGYKDNRFFLDCPIYDEGDDEWMIESIVPYLRPMSSMTEEEKEELLNRLPKYWGLEIDKLGDLYFDICDACYPDIELLTDIIDWLNEHHFDYRGLIPKGLAIAVTEENNPYKE